MDVQKIYLLWRYYDGGSEENSLPQSFDRSSASFCFRKSEISWSSFRTHPAKDGSRSTTRSKSASASSGFQAPMWAFPRRKSAFILSGSTEKFVIIPLNLQKDSSSTTRKRSTVCLGKVFSIESCKRPREEHSFSHSFVFVQLSPSLGIDTMSFSADSTKNHVRLSMS